MITRANQYLAAFGLVPGSPSAEKFDPPNQNSLGIRMFVSLPCFIL